MIVSAAKLWIIFHICCKFKANFCSRGKISDGYLQFQEKEYQACRGILFGYVMALHYLRRKL